MALDPRTKLYLVALANLLLIFHVDVVVESLTVLLLLLPLLGAGRWAAAVRFGCIYVLLLVGLGHRRLTMAAAGCICLVCFVSASG